MYERLHGGALVNGVQSAVSLSHWIRKTALARVLVIVAEVEKRIGEYVQDLRKDHECMMKDKLKATNDLLRGSRKQEVRTSKTIRQTLANARPILLCFWCSPSAPDYCFDSGTNAGKILGIRRGAIRNHRVVGVAS